MTAAAPQDMNPTWMGYSIGRWNGDEFVVQTAGFNDKGWLDNAGIRTPQAARDRALPAQGLRSYGHRDYDR